jgi:hypothetical protein
MVAMVASVVPARRAIRVERQRPCRAEADVSKEFSRGQSPQTVQFKGSDLPENS